MNSVISFSVDVLRFAVSAHWVCGGCGIVEFVRWCIIELVIKPQNDWRDIGRPQTAVVVAIFSTSTHFYTYNLLMYTGQHYILTKNSFIK